MMGIKYWWLIGCIAAWLAAPAVALKSDRDQPAIIDADNVELDFETGVRTYTGNVSVKQGSLVVHADKLVVKYKDDVLQTATAWGNPARFRQRPDGKDEDVRGRAPHMVIDEVGEKVHLYEDAVVIQGRNTVRSQEIHYDMNTTKVVVKGGATTKSATTEDGGPAAGSGGRARIVIQPKDKEPPTTPPSGEDTTADTMPATAGPDGDGDTPQSPNAAEAGR